MMTTRADMVREIKIAARVAELRRLAERTARAYDEAVAASGLPPEHFRLRLMLRGLLPPPRNAHSAALCVYNRIVSWRDVCRRRARQRDRRRVAVSAFPGDDRHVIFAHCHLQQEEEAQSGDQCKIEGRDAHAPRHGHGWHQQRNQDHQGDLP